jgi:hypothetical protein
MQQTEVEGITLKNCHTGRCPLCNETRMVVTVETPESTHVFCFEHLKAYILTLKKPVIRDHFPSIH